MTVCKKNPKKCLLLIKRTLINLRLTPIFVDFDVEQDKVIRFSYECNM